LRRAGFGASVAEIAQYNGVSLSTVITNLVEYERQPDDVDARIGGSGVVGVTARSGAFSPNTNIEDARQRWLFRMVHSKRPLQEKMTLFWHQHFATAYSKVAGAVGALQGTKLMALVDGEFPGPRGQIELFRSMALGRFRDLLVEVAKNPAMLIWLDGRSNTKAQPQENFGRELMELFTIGVGQFTEQDVYAAARVFTGWNMRINAGGSNSEPNSYYEFLYRENQHETSAKTFSFAVNPDGSRTIPARSAGEGMQDGLDLITALARHPETARRLARKLWHFFISDLEAPPVAFIQAVSEVYLRNDTSMRPVVDYVLRSSWFLDPRSLYARYAWPVEFVARAIKETGWEDYSLNDARVAAAAMGQSLFEPPDVNGWEAGAGWISTGAMLARMNFASALAASQRSSLAREIPASARSAPDRVVGAMLDRLSPMAYGTAARSALVGYVGSGSTWSGSDEQLNTKAPSLARLILGSAEYQLV